VGKSRRETPEINAVTVSICLTPHQKTAPFCPMFPDTSATIIFIKVSITG
jgi:hypothetical protein